MQNRINVQAEALAAIKENNYTGILLASVRSGKTKIAIDAIIDLDPKKILWVTHDTDLRDKKTPDEFRKFKATKYLARTKFICERSLPKVKGKFDLIVWDEYQHITENNTANLLDGTVLWDYMLFMSGTHPKNKVKNDILKELGLKVIYRLTIDNAAKKGIVADYDITVHNFWLDNIKKNCKTKRGLVTEYTKYKQLTWVINSMFDKGRNPKYIIQARMHLLYGSLARQRLATKLIKANADKRGLIFHPYKKNAEQHRHYFHSTSTDGHYNDFSYKKINHLHLVHKGGTGHTYKDLDFCIVTQANSNKTGGTTQKWGRSLLPRKGYKAQIHILCAKGTVDEGWVKEALKDFDSKKINYL